MKKSIRINIYWVMFFLISFPFCITGLSQPVTVSGVVKNAVTEEPIPYIMIGFTGTDIETMSSDSGYFSISNNAGIMSIRLVSMEYGDTVIVLNSNRVTNLIVMLKPSSLLLESVVFRAGREHYTRKDNPAIAFIREVIARKNENRLEAKPYYKVERYEKFSTFLDNFKSHKKIYHSGLFAKFIDTSEINGHKVLALSMKESLQELYFRKSPHALKEKVKARRQEGVWQDFDESTNQNLQELFREVNLYDNTVELFYNQFVSPLSSTLALATYKYYIQDTVVVDGIPCMKMVFSPFSQQSIGFIGSLYITLDGNYALKKAEMNIPRKANLNFADNLTITQNFTQLADSTWVVSEENLSVNLYIFKGIPELLLHRTRIYRDYNFDFQDNTIYNSSFNDLEEETADTEKSDDYWLKNRPIPLKQKENGIKKMLDELRKKPLYQFIVRASDFFSSGYFVAGGSKQKSYFNIGPLGSIVSKNDIEGLHFRLGGTTTANLSKHAFISGHIAYGVYDKKLKYNGKFTYSFNKKKYHENEFPRNKISAMYDYDLYAPGAVFQENKDNFLVAWNVGKPITKMSYLRRALIGYEVDLPLGLGVEAWVKHQMDYPTGTLKYQYTGKDDLVHNIRHLTTFEVGVKMVYRIGGRPFDGINSRNDLSKRITEFSLTHYAGIKNVLGSNYSYQRTEFSVKSRIQMATFGYIDARFNAGKVWTKSPFPLQIIPNAYQSIMLQPNAFQMMNAMEFVADQYLSLNATYHLNGLIFNRIPYFNWLKFREVISFNCVYGELTNRNNPQKTQGLFLLPDGTQALGKVPYFEIGVGIENIFKVLRIEYYRRLNYLGPGVSKNGVRFSLGFTF